MNELAFYNRTSPKITVETITPDIAKKLLDLNTANFRKLDARRVEHYASAIRRGEWALTGDTIKITDGILIDGQTRLHAVVAANKSIETAIAWNIAESAVCVDRGKPRTISQWLSHEGHANATQIAAMARLSVVYDKGLWQSLSFPVNTYTDMEVISYANTHREALQSALHLTKKAGKLIAASTAGAIAHISAKRLPIEDADNKELIEWFWNGLANGENLDEFDPPLVLRNRLIAEKVSKAKKLENFYVRWIATIAWNASVIGNPITQAKLRVRSTGPAKSQPPEKILLASEDDS